MKHAPIYLAVIAISAIGGYFAGTSLRANTDAPTISQPGAITRAAAVAAAAATDADPNAPDITMPALGGGELSLSEWDGQLRLINFWATWCAPCRREIPLLKSIQEDQPVSDLQVVGVALDEMDAVTEYDGEINFNYPILVGDEGALAIADQYQLELMALPFTLIVWRDGTLLNAHIGDVDEEEAAHIIDVLQRLDQQQITISEAKEQLSL
ncbi:MAG: TlpA disulfide reductase family protein [Pseudomonadota bacterium]